VGEEAVDFVRSEGLFQVHDRERVLASELHKGLSILERDVDHGLRCQLVVADVVAKGGGVEHMRVAVVMPNERIVMTGSLGPLLYEAASGVMDVKFDKIAGGTKVTLNYRAAGFANANADKMAPLVDSVLADQMKRFRAFAARGGGK